MRRFEMRDVAGIANDSLPKYRHIKASCATIIEAARPLDADPELFHAVNVKTLRNTMLGNFLNLPGFALPSGMDANGLPTSILISAPPSSETTLFAASLAVEAL